MTHIQHLKKLISLYDIERVLTILSDPTIEVDQQLNNDAIILSARYKKLKKAKYKGVLDPQTELVEFSRITNALLEILDDLPPTFQTKFKKVEISLISIRYFLYRSRFWIFTLISLLLLWWLADLIPNPKYSIKTKIEIDTYTLDFIAGRGREVIIDTPIDLVDIYNFEELTVHGEKLLFNTPPITKDPIFLNNGYVIVVANSMNPTQAVFFESSFESFQFEKNSFISLNLSKSYQNTGENPITIEAIPGNFSAVFNYQDSINFQVTNASIKVADTLANSDASFLGGTLIGQEGFLNEIHFQGSKDLNVYLNFLPKIGLKEFQISDQNIPVDTLNFSKKEIGPETISNIQTGKIYFLNTRNQPYDSIEISPNYLLVPFGYQNVRINSIVITEESIRCNIIGQFDQIKVGPNNSDLVLVNPRKLQWYFWNNSLPLIFIPLTYTALSILMFFFVRKRRFS